MPQLTYPLSDIEEAARFVIRHLHSHVILLEGDMGSGKTTLIKEIAKQLGSSDEVSSPTFAIVNEYGLPGKKIYHFDLYRLKDELEALDFGIEEYLYDQEAYSFIEWPGIIENILPANSQKIRIIVKDFQTRELQID